jgi:hypothetical protein
VTVYRKDMSHGFSFPGRYPANGGNKQYAPEMALKAAEAHALRRAFEVTGLPILDERRQEPAPAAPSRRVKVKAERDETVDQNAEEPVTDDVVEELFKDEIDAPLELAE